MKQISKGGMRALMLAFVASTLAACGSQIKIEPVGVAPSPVRAAEAVPRTQDRITAERVLHLRDQMTQNELAKTQLAIALHNYDIRGHRLVSPDEAEMRRLQEIFTKVHQRSHLAQMALRPVLVEKDVFQAYTLGGLEVVFYTGLTESLSDDGLAVIVGHEIAHIAAGHAVEQVSRDVVNLDHNHSQEARLSGFYSVEAEYEADMIGLLYATLAGYDGRKAAEIWETLAGIRQSPKFNLFTTTHPPDALRDTRLRQQAADIMALRGTANWQDALNCNPLYCAN